MTDTNETHQSRERLARLETSVEHIDNNLKHVINNTQIQHDTLLKLTTAVELIGETLTHYKGLDIKVDNVEKDVICIKESEKNTKSSIIKIEKQITIVKYVFIGILLGILFTIVPISSLPTLILKILGVPV